MITKKSTSSFIVASVLLSIGLVACPAPVVDTAPPTIVSTVPANGATGVAADANIVITFSKPMNKIATQNAYQSATILPLLVQFSWNANGTVLTIDPTGNLNVASGTDPANVVATEFSFQITNVASDLAGNALTTTSSSFKTARRISQTMPANSTLSGDIFADGTVAPSFPARVGDFTNNSQFKGLVTFNIASLPTDIGTFEKADLILTQTSVDGTPYGSTNLGTVNLEHVAFASFTKPLAYDAPSLGTTFSPDAIFSTNTAIEVKTKSVIPAVLSDYTNRTSRGNRSQYRLTFTTAATFNGIRDSASFSSPELKLTYLLP